MVLIGSCGWTGSIGTVMNSALLCQGSFMSLDQVLASTGFGWLVADEFFVTQIGVLTLTGILFAASLALCIMAMRAAFTAKRARNEAQLTVASMQDMAVEMRQLTAQVERASYAQTHVEQDDEASEAGDKAGDDASLGANETETGPPADEGKTNKKRPSALLRGFLSRR